jgi:hypothetical protein
MKITETIRLITYPRSGLNFFRALIAHHGYRISASHDIDFFLPAPRVVTIIRNPKSSIASHYAMISEYNDKNNLDALEPITKEYINHYKWFDLNAEYFILYENLINEPKKTVEDFFKYFNIPYESVENYNRITIKDDPSSLHITSSAGLPKHSEALTNLRRLAALEDAEKAYEELIRKHSIK